MRIGAKVPNSGPLPERLGIGAMAAELEAAGFESLWVSDHIVLPETIESRYPFAEDGRATWATDTPYFDAMIALALIAQATERATIGTAVLVLPLRQPVVFAKQAASIDVASGGRLSLGVGAGWLEEEFDALNVPYAGRGRRLDEWIAITRACWTGTPAASVVRALRPSAGVLCLPRPAHPVPLLVGGHSGVALRRAGTDRVTAGSPSRRCPSWRPDDLVAPDRDDARRGHRSGARSRRRSRSCCGSSSRPGGARSSRRGCRSSRRPGSTRSSSTSRSRTARRRASTRVCKEAAGVSARRPRRQGRPRHRAPRAASARSRPPRSVHAEPR